MSGTLCLNTSPPHLPRVSSGSVWKFRRKNHPFHISYFLRLCDSTVSAYSDAHVTINTLIVFVTYLLIYWVTKPYQQTQTCGWEVGVGDGCTGNLSLHLKYSSPCIGWSSSLRLSVALLPPAPVKIGSDSSRPWSLWKSVDRFWAWPRAVTTVCSVPWPYSARRSYNQSIDQSNQINK